MFFFFLKRFCCLHRVFGLLFLFARRPILCFVFAAAMAKKVFKFSYSKVLRHQSFALILCLHDEANMKQTLSTRRGRVY